ncbi:hypothetical protein VCHC49A2_3823, partial [Vibrio cholerae HC-49A2]
MLISQDFKSRILHYFEIFEKAHNARLRGSQRYY